MNKKYLIIAGIILAIAVIAGGVWLYSQEEQPVAEKCDNNLDCPAQMKCENSICVDVGCVEAGGTIPGAISPEYKEHMATECCSGLKRITYSGNYDEDCVVKPLMGGPSAVCSNCGDGICEEWETKCNCPEDCQ